jgi:deoxyribodipyrimidine photo-lyase
VQQHAESGDARVAAACAKVMEGRSGVAIMDRFAKELIETGYLHNHARMWFASFWIHQERLPWELGAAFFYRHLLDADAASNTLSWRWVAGLHTPGKTYLARRTNLERYVDKAWLHDTTGLDRLDDSVALPVTVADSVDRTPGALMASDPLPVNQERIGLWLHEEDGCLECGELAHLQPVALLMDASCRTLRAWNLSTVREAALGQIMQDASQRAGLHFQTLVQELNAVGSLPTVMAEAVAALKLKSLVAFAPCVGPLWEIIPEIRRALKAVGCELCLVYRKSDTVIWPNARKGFFDFWSRTEGSLSEQWSQDS